MTRIDTGLFDFANRLRPVGEQPDVVLVEIDDASLGQIGRWPWPRAVHAAMLGELTRAGARAIGLDLLLAEPGSDDTILDEAIAAAAPTVLPVSAYRIGSERPWPLYPSWESGHRSRLAHAHFRIDDDGAVRGLSLEEAGLPAFSLGVLDAGGRTPDAAPARRALLMATQSRRESGLATGTWPSSEFVLLPVVRAATQRESYAAVLRGEVDMRRFAGRLVFVGATARGLGDTYANAVVDESPVVSGVELHVAAASALAAETMIRRVPFALQAALAAAFVLVTMALLYRSRPRAGLMLVGALAASVVASSVGLLAAGHWWPPGGALAGVLSAYPLWSWRRLEAAMSGLVEQARRLRAEPDPFQRTSALRAIAEPVARELESLSDAADRIKTLRHLLSTILDRLPHPAIVTDVEGHVLLCNRIAHADFASLPADGEDLRPWLAAEFGDRRWLSRLTGSAPDVIHGVDAFDRAGRDWLIDVDRAEDPGLPTLWLLQFADISKVRQVQREREQMMRFLSHDLRAPQVSILSALDQLPQGPDYPPWAAIVERHAQRSLELAESFVQWARAENKPLDNEPIDLVGILAEAIDTTWPMAIRARVRVACEAPEQAPAVGDAQLLRRAIANLIDNAIKYGRPDSTVDVRLADEGEHWVITVADLGPGIAAEHVERLFQPYFRGSGPGERGGSGLGLALVRMVAERHGGTAAASNRAGGGAVFCIRLPAAL